MIIKVYADLSPEHLLEQGKAAGLSDEAQNYFRFFSEIELELHVDPETGAVRGATVTQQFNPKKGRKEHGTKEEGKDKRRSTGSTAG